MLLLAGLGNPGKEYANNRHNIGFRIVDEIAKKYFVMPFRKKFRGEICEGKIDKVKVLILKPSTYMNRSGESVLEAMSFFKLRCDQLIVFHDEMDLVAGKVRVKKGGGHGGHNGLRSIHDHIGVGYSRVRIGVGHPGKKELVVNYVLQDFSKSDQLWLQALKSEISGNIPLLIKGSETEFMNRIALALNPYQNLAGEHWDHSSKIKPVESRKVD